MEALLSELPENGPKGPLPERSEDPRSKQRSWNQEARSWVFNRSNSVTGKPPPVSVPGGNYSRFGIIQTTIVSSGIHSYEFVILHTGKHSHDSETPDKCTENKDIAGVSTNGETKEPQ